MCLYTEMHAISLIKSPKGGSVSLLGVDEEYDAYTYVEIYLNGSLIASCHVIPMVLHGNGDRKEMFRNGSLLIYNLTDSDSGNYSLQVNSTEIQTVWLEVVAYAQTPRPKHLDNEDSRKDTRPLQRKGRFIILPLTFVVFMATSPGRVIEHDAVRSRAEVSVRVLFHRLEHNGR
ncbi:---NA--- [Pelobates cultripes]|uniref:---NA n=1 Tax=Pelobates cultripes TaxID=61616 RepID=A0AAD1W8E8_PELCU|nr:---NA--- [Pelobates cultripes]